MEFPDLPGEASASQINIYFEDVEFELPEFEQILGWLADIPEAEGRILDDLSFIFCSDEKLRLMNVEYLGHDYFTDVITFPYGEERIAGDVFISADRVSDNARQNKVPFVHELCRVMAHGVLHLCGYGDKTPEEQKVMREKENHYLALTTGFLPKS